MRLARDRYCVDSCCALICGLLAQADTAAKRAMLPRMRAILGAFDKVRPPSWRGRVGGRRAQRLRGPSLRWSVNSLP